MSNEIKNYLNQFNLSNIQRPISLTREEDLLSLNKPLSFKDWLNQHTSIQSGNEYREYNIYLRKWYALKDENKKVQAESIRNDYVNFLKELSLVFRDDPDFKYIADIDFDDNLDIEYAIPYFTKKIKEICFYIIGKRESSKNAKLKYNMAGATQALEKLFYQYLLQAFTQRNSLILVPEFSGVELLPALSSVSNSFHIYVEELNDDGSYFDKDPMVINYQDMNLASYFKNVEYDSSDYEWIFNSGTMPLCSDNPFFWTLEQTLQEYGVDDINLVPFSAVDLSDQLNPTPNEVNLSLLSKKYVGNNFYLLTGGYYELKTDLFNFDFSPQNNWFYWPSGEAFFETYDTPTYDPLELNESSLIESGATYSSDYRQADKIFVQKNREILGAWLRYYRNFLDTRMMSCALPAGQEFKFKFPYCDYGIVGDGSAWTGRGISNIDTLYNTLDDESKKIVDRIYWNYTTSTERICAMGINETELVYNGAYPSIYYNSADKISKRTATGSNKVNDSNPDGVYKDGFEYAWLYKFLKTDLPIKVGQTTHQWPIQRVEDIDDELLNVDRNFCAPTPLSAINIDTFLGARAGYILSDSDIIYKLNANGGYPIECAFLRGEEIAQSLPNGLVTGSTDTTYVSSVTGIMQIGLTVKCKPDMPETFIWQDDDIELNQINIKYRPHQDDCPYALHTDKVSIFEQKDAGEFEFNYPWKDCECKSVMYSPIGHPGSNYDDFSGMADIILLDTQDPNPFSLNEWRGDDGFDYRSSSDFAWYRIEKTQTNNQQGLDVDVGMGVGSWVTGSGAPFILKTGRQYKYIRTGLKRTYDELLAGSVPSMVISYKYNHNFKPTWRKARLTPNGTWVETPEVTDMVLNAGDYIFYDHFQSNFYCLRYNGTYGEFIVDEYRTSAVNLTDDYWVNFTYATTGIVINYKWPDVITNQDSPTFPTTNTLASELSSVRWEVQINSQPSYTSNLSPEQRLTVVSYLDATINVSVTGFSINGPAFSYELNPVTIVAPERTETRQFSGEKFIQTIYSDSINFMLNVPLSGWNYSENIYDGSSLGAKPFWGEAVDDDSYTTKFKGVREWGYGLRVADEYTLIHQPKVSFMTLNVDDTIKYDKKHSTIIWKQPVDFIVDDETKEWCDLIIEAEKTSPLSSYLFNADKELTVYPTSTRSNLVLEQDDFVNYWAINDFTWSQRLTDSSVGVPPFGGTFIPFASSLIIPADVPFANLTNRHYPSIAMYPNANTLYSDRDSGGYFNHKGLGVLTYVSRDYLNTINPELTSNSLQGADLLFRDPNVFASDDIGLTNKPQRGPIKNVSNNALWMKGKQTEGYKAGSVVGESDFKEFSPYQTREETIGRNNNGIIDIDFDLSPWYGKFNNEWKDTINWPPNFRKEYPIKKWNYALNLFVDSQTVSAIQKSINLKPPYFCPNYTSRHIISKEFIGTTCLGANIQEPIASFSGVDILVLPSVPPVYDGGLILQVNRDFLKNNYLPIYNHASLESLNADPEKVFYGERRTGLNTLLFGYISIIVNGDTFYTPVHRSKRTSCEVSNLSGVFDFNSSFTQYGYMPIHINETQKGFIELFTL